jgi:hypothetical protein
MASDHAKESTSKRTVRFSDITIQCYPIIVGDTPGGTSGPPLAIDWEVISSTCISVDEYEQSRPAARNKVEMMMPSQHRTQLLKNSGFTKDEIRVGTKSANLARARRKITLQNLHMSKVHEAFELSLRKVHTIISGGSKKNQEKALMDQSRHHSAATSWKPKGTVGKLRNIDQSHTSGSSVSVAINSEINSQRVDI